MASPDGMASMAQERNHMREVQQGVDFTHDVVAIDEDGNEVFETESLYANEVDYALDDYPEGDDAPEGVDHYEIRKR